MPAIDWLAVLRKAASDIAANAPPPDGPPLSNADMAAMLTAALPELALLQAHRGAVTALGDVLAGIDAPWAGEFRRGLFAAFALATTAEGWIPTIVGALKAFAPEPVDSPVSPRDPTQFSRGGH